MSVRQTLQRADSVCTNADTRGERPSLRCAHCTGNLYLKRDIPTLVSTEPAHIFALVCLQCGRVAAYVPATELVQTYGVRWQDIDKPGMPFLWLVPAHGGHTCDDS